MTQQPMNHTADGLPVSIRVAGFCPMGCGESLLVDQDGRMVCCAADCPRPDTLAVILGNPETEHLVQVGLTAYTIQHPLRERAESLLFSCPVHAYVSDTVHLHMGTPGLYRVAPYLQGDGAVRWERIGDADT
jgi:hypothetical protein